jgi:hypothetical protein
VSLASPYWGIQKLSSFPKRILQVFDGGSRYVDLTAGGGGMVFHRAKQGQPVHGNDRNTYAASAFEVACILQTMSVEAIEAYAGYFAADWHHPPAETGYVASHQDDAQLWVPKVTPEVAHYIDQQCSVGIVNAYFVVRSLLKLLSVRCRAWDKDDSDARRARTDVHFLAGYVRDEFERFAGEVRGTGYASITGSNSSAEYLKEFVQPGDVVYTDPAWPWSPAEDAKGFDQSNPYDFLTCAAGSILEQREIVPDSIPFWTANDVEKIYDDTAQWIRDAFDAGARAFVLSSQGTNWPHPDLALAMAAERSGAPLKHYEYRVATTRRSNTPFTEWFGVYVP